VDNFWNPRQKQGQTHPELSEEADRTSDGEAMLRRWRQRQHEIGDSVEAIRRRVIEDRIKEECL
jgi:hypothetical protein